MTVYLIGPPHALLWVQPTLCLVLQWGQRMMTLKEHPSSGGCLLLVRQQNTSLGNSRLGLASEAEIYIKGNMFFS